MKKNHLRNQILLMALLFSAVFFIVIAPLFNLAIDRIYDRNYSLQAEEIVLFLNQELESLKILTEELSGSEELKIYQQELNGLELYSYLVEKKDRQQLDTFLVTDSWGMVLTRTKSPNYTGDFIYQTTSWGRVLNQENAINSIESGVVWPLIMISGLNTYGDEDQKLGTVATINILDNSYAKRFIDKYDLGNNHLAFYTKNRGVVGQSFENPETQRNVLTYFNSASEFVQKGIGGERISLEERNYFVENIVFVDTEGIEIGGALIFVNYNPSFQNTVFALTLALVFVLSLMLLFRYYKPSGQTRYKLLTLTVVAIIVLGFGGNKYFLDQKVTFLPSPGHIIYNATLGLDPEFAIIDRNQEHRVAVIMSVGGETVNAVEAVLNFNPEMIQVESIDTTNSFCSENMFIERSIDNDNGQVRVICGVVGGFHQPLGTVAELVFSPLQEGSFNIDFDSDSEVVAHDGLGTRVMRMAVGGSYQTIDRLAPGDNTTLLFSPSHPNSNRWYNQPKARFIWRDLGQKELRYFYELDSEPGTVPTKDNPTFERSVDLPITEDGVFYFHLSAAEQGEVIETVHRQIKVDRTPPTPPEIRVNKQEVQRGEVVRFEFRAGSSTSGMQSTFYVKVNNGILMPVGPQMFMTFSSRGNHTLTLRVFDNANNYSESSMVITVR